LNFESVFAPAEIMATAVDHGDRCFDFKNIFAEKFGEKIGVFDSNKAKLCKILIIKLILRKTPIFSQKIGKNRRKL
jgi:hypothetical protein